MKQHLIKFLTKISNVRYLSVWAVLVIDILFSLFATVISVYMMRLLTDHHLITEISVLRVLAFSVITSFLAFFLFKTYRKAIRHSTIVDIGLLCITAFVKSFVTYSVLLVFWELSYGKRYLFFSGLADFLLTAFFLVGFRAIIVFVYEGVRKYFRADNDRKRVLIYGTSDKSLALVTRLQGSPHFQITGFLCSREDVSRIHILDLPLYWYKTEQDLASLCAKLNLDGIIFSTSREAQLLKDSLVDYASKCNISIYLAPGIDNVSDGKFSSQNVRKINIEDLLGRDEIKINMDRIVEDFSGKTIMVTGAAGSIGSELCRLLATFGIGKLILFDNAETPMHTLRLELESKFPELDFVPVIGDVRLLARLDFAMRTFRPDIVFHAAAYKHVPLMEENPCEAVLVNAVGSRNVADKCVEYAVKKMVMISTDKAVNPTNIMGCTKRLAEIYVQSLGHYLADNPSAGVTQFVTTRFGNVLGSNGSVIPLFREQIENGGPVTVTHPDITRFFMTIPEACRLVMEAACMGNNQIFVFDMGQSVKIYDLATKMISLAGLRPEEDIKIQFTGLRPGEKLYEEVLANTENTMSTQHDRIRIAKVRDYSYTCAKSAIEKLETLSRSVDIPDMVKFMKNVVPEFKSRNSQFEKYDSEESGEDR